MRLSILISIFCVGLALANEPKIEVYHPKFKSADDLARIGNGLISSAKFQAVNDTVVISAEKHEPLTAAKKLFEEIDRKTKQYVLRMRLRQSRKRSDSRYGANGIVASAETGSGGDEAQVIVQPGGAGNIDFQHTRYNFTTRPRGNAVELQIGTEQNQSTSIHTIVTVPMKKWTTIALLNSNTTNANTTITSAKNAASESGSQLQVRIEEQ